MNLARFVAFAFLPVLLSAQDPALTPLDKLKVHGLRIVDPLALAGSAAGAEIQLLRKSVPEWGQGAAGYGKQYASVHGYIAAQNLFAFGLDSVLHEDPRFHYSVRKGFWPRTRDAAAQTFITRTDSGGRSFNYWRFGSNYGAGLISTLWYPDRLNGIGAGVSRGSIGLGYDTIANVLHEFWPEIRRTVFRRKASAAKTADPITPSTTLK